MNGTKRKVNITPDGEIEVTLEQKLTKYSVLDTAYYLSKKIIEEGMDIYADTKDHIKRQEQIIDYFDSEINSSRVPEESKVKCLKEWILGERESKEKAMLGHLRGFETNLKKANPDLISKTNLLVTIYDELTGEIKQKITPVGQGHLLESNIKHYVENYSDIYLPKFEDPKKVEILEAQNFILYEKENKFTIEKNIQTIKQQKNNFLFDPINIRSFKKQYENAEYVIMARVKESSRELEKIVDWITGIKNTFHKDTTGIIIVSPSDKYLTVFQDLKNRAGSEFDYEFDEYYKEIGDILQSNKPFPKKNIDLINILKNHKNSFINQEEQIIDQLNAEWLHRQEYGKPLKKFTDIVSEDIKRNNLKFLKVFYGVGGFRSEAILMSKYQFDLYRGIFGHHVFFEEERNSKRQEKMLRNNVDLISKHIFEHYSPLFPKTKISLINNGKSSGFGDSI